MMMNLKVIRIKGVETEAESIGLANKLRLIAEDLLTSKPTFK